MKQPLIQLPFYSFLMKIWICEKSAADCYCSLSVLCFTPAGVCSPSACFPGPGHSAAGTLWQPRAPNGEKRWLRQQWGGELLCRELEIFIAYRSRSQSIYTKRKAGTPSWENMWIDWGPAWREGLVGSDSCLGSLITGSGAEVLELLLEAKNSRKVGVLSKIVQICGEGSELLEAYPHFSDSLVVSVCKVYELNTILLNKKGKK